MYKLYQIRVTKADRDAINAGTATAAQQALFDSMFRIRLSDDDAPTVTDPSIYSHVANLAVTDLDACFEVGNVGPESAIERLNPMHSVSVGDVLVAEDDTAHIVCGVGFAELKDFVIRLVA